MMTSHIYCINSKEVVIVDFGSRSVEHRWFSGLSPKRITLVYQKKHLFTKMDLPTCLCHILSVWLFNDRGHLAFGQKFAVRKTCFNFNRRARTEMWGIGGPDPHRNNHKL